MSTVSKVLTLLIMGALLVLVITHPAGFAADAVSGGSVLDNTLSLETGAGAQGGVNGTIPVNGGNILV
jgi:hypothetical protein